MTDTWLTPRHIIEDLGPFDFDPCAAPEPRPWPTACQHIAMPQDGLALPWMGFVWLNPPYSDPKPWMQRMAEHDSGICLTFAKTGTSWFFDSAWASAAGFMFLKGRIRFFQSSGQPGHTTASHPSVLIGYSDEAMRRLAQSGLVGHLVINAPAFVLGSGAPETWRQVILEAMAGRPLRLPQLYAAVAVTQKGLSAMRAGVKWREKIRRVLQEHFRPIDRGVWAPA